MNLLRPLLRDITWKRLLLALALTTLATAIVRPYFNHDISFEYLWFRLFVVTFVMLVLFSIAGVIHENIAHPPISRLRAQFVALGFGTLVGPVVSSLAIGRSINEMFTVEPMFWGMVIFTSVSIVIGVATGALLVYRARAATAETEIARAESKQSVGPRAKRGGNRGRQEAVARNNGDPCLAETFDGRRRWRTAHELRRVWRIARFE